MRFGGSPPSGNQQIWRVFFGLTVVGFAREDLSEICGRNPMLSFLRQVMVGDAQEADETDLNADFLARLADGALLQRLEIVDFSADNAPATGFRRPISEREQDAVEFIHQEDANADAGTRLVDLARCIGHMGGCRRVISNHFDGRDAAGCPDTRNAGNTRSARA